MKKKNYEDSNVNIISFTLLIVGVILVVVACYLFFVFDPVNINISFTDSIKSLLSFGFTGIPLILKHYLLPLILMISGLITTVVGTLILLIINWKNKVEGHNDLEIKDNFIFQGIMITVVVLFLMFFIYLLLSIMRLFMI